MINFGDVMSSVSVTDRTNRKKNQNRIFKEQI